MLVILNVLLLILTLQRGKDSTILGETIASWLIKTFNLSLAPEVLHHYLRTFAHILLFLAEGYLLYEVFGWKGAIVIGVMSIVLEIIKIPIPGRHFNWADVGLNVLGSIIGILLGKAI